MISLKSLLSLFHLKMYRFRHLPKWIPLGRNNPALLRIDYDIRKIKAGLSLDEEFLTLAGRTLVRKIRPVILFGDADHELQ
jgi:hypothetical protein